MSNVLYIFLSFLFVLSLRKKRRLGHNQLHWHALRPAWRTDARYATEFGAIMVDHRYADSLCQSRPYLTGEPLELKQRMDDLIRFLHPEFPRGEVTAYQVKREYTLRKAFDHSVFGSPEALTGWEFEEKPHKNERIVFTAPPMIHPSLHYWAKWDDEAQELYLRKLEEQFGLPPNFLSFGNAQTVSAVMLESLRYSQMFVGGLGGKYYIHSNSVATSGGHEAPLFFYYAGARFHIRTVHDGPTWTLFKLIQGILEL